MLPAGRIWLGITRLPISSLSRSVLRTRPQTVRNVRWYAQQTVNFTPQPKTPGSDKVKAPTDAINSKKKDLAVILRKFYRVVHPDLVRDDHAREVNEHSMKDFMSFISAYKARPYGPYTNKPKEIPLTFYIPDYANSVDPTQPKLKAIQANMLQNATNPASAKRRLMSLFAACGLENEFVVSDPVLEAGFLDYGSDLFEYLRTSVPVAREATTRNSEDVAQTNKLIASLERKFGFQVLEGYFEDYTPKENLKAVNQLLSFSSEAQNEEHMKNLNGFDVVLSEEDAHSGITEDGVICLSRGESEEQWAKFLKRLDWEEARDRSKKEKARSTEWYTKKQQLRDNYEGRIEKVVELLGVADSKLILFNKIRHSVSADNYTINTLKWTDKERENWEAESDDMTITDVYENMNKFIDRLMARKDFVLAEKRKYPRKMKALMVNLCPDMPPGLRYHLGFDGEILISTSATPEEVMLIMQNKGKQALGLVGDHTKWNNMTQYILARLGLECLDVEDTFFASPNAQQKIQTALKNLNEFADQTKSSPLSKMTVLISDKFGVSGDGKLYLKWDFTVGEMQLQLEGRKGADATIKAS